MALSFEEFCKPVPEDEDPFAVPEREDVCYLSIFFVNTKTGVPDDESLFDVPVRFRGSSGTAISNGRFGFVWKFVVLDDHYRKTKLNLEILVEGRGVYLDEWYFAVLDTNVPKSVDKYASMGH